MDLNKIDQLLVLHGAKIPPEGLPMIREKLMNCSDETMAQLVFSQLKNPTLALILSIALGYWGIDRFYIGDLPIGAGKLLTCGGAWIWYIIDIFMIMDATKKKNLEMIMTQIR